jgi:hypothetical protein
MNSILKEASALVFHDLKEVDLKRRYLAVSEGAFGVTDGGMAHCCFVGRGQGCYQTFCSAQDTPPTTPYYADQNMMRLRKQVLRGWDTF